MLSGALLCGMKNAGPVTPYFWRRRKMIPFEVEIRNTGPPPLRTPSATTGSAESQLAFRTRISRNSEMIPRLLPADSFRA